MKINLFDFQKDALQKLREKLVAARRDASPANPQAITLSAPTCSIPDDHIDPRRTALFMARSILQGYRDGGPAC
jgi:hypothetical protein